MSPAMTKSRGFSLIELMIVVAIMAILAAIAFPAFDNQTRKSNRAAAQAVLMDAANKQQFYLTSQREYADTLAKLNITPPNDVSRWYDITLVVDNAATPPTFTFTATPKAGSAQAADGALTLDGQGTKTRLGDPTKW